MSKAPIRVYLKDDSWKTFLLTEETTAESLCEQWKEKRPVDDGDVYLYYHVVADKANKHFIPLEDKVWPIYQKGSDIVFTFQNYKPKEEVEEEVEVEPEMTVTAEDFDMLLESLDLGLDDTALQIDAFAGEFASIHPICASCGMPVKDNQLVAFNMTWHKGCLACTLCSLTFAENPVKLIEGSDGLAYCEPCFLDQYAPKCARCEEPIPDEVTNAIGKTWHPKCFTCMTCNEPFEGSFFDHEGQPYCETHYFEKLGLLCKGCDKPIIGKCVNARGVRYHPEHFVCYHCKRRLKGNNFFWHEPGAPYCKDDSVMLFG